MLPKAVGSPTTHRKISKHEEANPLPQEILMEQIRCKTWESQYWWTLPGDAAVFPAGSGAERPQPQVPDTVQHQGQGHMHRRLQKWQSLCPCGELSNFTLTLFHGERRVGTSYPFLCGWEESICSSWPR